MKWFEEDENYGHYGCDGQCGSWGCPDINRKLRAKSKKEESGMKSLVVGLVLLPLVPFFIIGYVAYTIGRWTLEGLK